MDKFVPAREREVSLIMTLGRVVFLFKAYGPPGPGESFAKYMMTKIPNVESEFRNTDNLDKLEKDLWFIRCISKQYDEYVKEFTKVRHPDLAHIVNRGHSPASGCDGNGEYTFNNCPYAAELGEFPLYGLKMPDGRFVDPHEGWEDLDLEDEIMKLIPQIWLE